MTTISQQYRIVNAEEIADLVNQLNAILIQISDRLDQIEGRRGYPTIKNQLDMDGNDILNVGTITYA